MVYHWWSKMNLLPWNIIVLLVVSTNSMPKDHVTRGLLVTTPRVWLVGSEEKTCLTSHSLDFDVHVDISLLKNGGSTLGYRNVTLPSGGSTCVELLVPAQASQSTAKVVVTAASVDPSITYNFSKSADVSIKQPTKMTFIQTDKPIYKPGDIVRIRILTLKGSDLKLLKDDISLAYIEDPSRTRVMQWTNISTVNGLGSLEIQMSDEPRLGEWTIKVNIHGITESQKFAVEEYVLPKYEVTIKHPSYLFYGAENITWKVCARYTYGQPVSGLVTSKACLVRFHAFKGANSPCYQTNSTKLKDGCLEFSINSADLNLKDYMWSSKLNIFAEVREHGTGVKLNSTFTAEIHSDAFRLKFIEKSLYYKPGLPFYGQGQLTQPDGTPVKGKLVRLETYTNNKDEKKNIKSFPLLDLTTDDNGMFQYILPGNFTSQNMTSISQNVKLLKDESGLSSPRAYRYLKAWFSPSRSFLQIEPFEGVAACHSTLALPVVFVTKSNLNSAPTLHFQLIARGDIVLTGKLNATSVDDSSLENEHGYRGIITFSVTHEISGSLKLLVFTILTYGETVADSQMVSVEECFSNHVSMDFADRQKQPGHLTTLHLSADPHSLCSISVMDKSMKLMKRKDNSLSKSEVFAMLKQYDIPRHSNYHIGNKDCGVVDQELGDIDPFFGLDYEVPIARRRKRTIMYPFGVQSDYVDSKEAFLDAGVIILSDLTVVTRPCYRRFGGYRVYFEEGADSQDLDEVPLMLPMMKVINNDNAITERQEKGSPVLHRNFFPESWLWQLKLVGDTGVENMNLTLPHTITEWVGDGFCANAESGLGVSSPFSINAFQPFFLSFTLPYSVIRGERVGIPVSVFNYLTQCLKVTLYVQKSSAFKLSNDAPVTELRVCGHKTETHTYHIVPRELGNVNFTIRASSVASDEVETNSIEDREIMTAEDIVTQKLLVEPEGKEEEQTKSAFVCAPAEGSWRFDLPDGLVPDSVRAFTSVIGDVMGPTLTGLESLLALPTGCGEQNMLKFSPNIFIMQYLQKTNSLTEEVKRKATEYLQTGYQRELTYRHKDGSYSAFGESDKEGSIWLTAFVIKSFAQARPFIYIDEKDLDKSIQWITSVQLENGCFPQIGRVLHKEMKGGLADEEDRFAALTAYVMAALMEAGMSSNDPVIRRAIQCLSIQHVEDTYTQSLMAYAYGLWNLNDTKYTEIMNDLQDKAVMTDGMKHWRMPNDTAAASPAAIEMSSYVLLSILHESSEEVVISANPIVRWLSSQRNSRGGFSSTQDTVLALQALAQFAAIVHSDNLDAQVTITGTNWDHSASVTNNNRLLLQKREGQTLPSRLQYTITGTGCVLLQASTKYNMITYQQDEEPAFQLSIEVHRSKNRNCKERSLKICTRYNGVDEVSNMAVIAVKMVSGWIPDKDSIKKLMNHANLRLKRYDIDKNVVQLYFEELDKTEKCLSFLVHQNVIVTKTKSVLVHVYDYYKPSLSTYADYSITSTCGTKEEIKNDGNEPLESRNVTKELLHNVTPKQMRIKDKELQTVGQMVAGNTGTRERTSAKVPKQSKCPECELHEATEINRRYCSTQNVYEALVVNKTTVTVLRNMRSGVNISQNVTYHLPRNCTCRALGNRKGVSVVLLLPKAVNFRKNDITLKLEARAAIIDGSKVNFILQNAADANTTVCP